VQCINPSTEWVKLPAASMLGRFHSVQEENEENENEEPAHSACSSPVVLVY